MNLYATAALVELHLAELRDVAERQHLARAARPSQSLRSALGQALVRLGTRLLSHPAPARVSA